MKTTYIYRDGKVIEKGLFFFNLAECAVYVYDPQSHTTKPIEPEGVCPLCHSSNGHSLNCVKILGKYEEHEEVQS